MIDLSLLEALSEIAVQEREWQEQGYCVGTLVKDPAHWARYGVFTRADLERYFDECADRQRQKDLWEEREAEWLAEMEAEEAQWRAEEERMEALHGWERTTPADIVANHYQEGWA
jgi:hypothetical protein